MGGNSNTTVQGLSWEELLGSSVQVKLTAWVSGLAIPPSITVKPKNSRFTRHHQGEERLFPLMYKTSCRRPPSLLPNHSVKGKELHGTKEDGKVERREQGKRERKRTEAIHDGYLRNKLTCMRGELGGAHKD